MVFSFARQPPTPPRDKKLDQDIDDILAAFDTPFSIEDDEKPTRSKSIESKPVQRKLFVDTPPEQSPSSSADSDQSRVAGRKQVNFNEVVPPPHQWSPAQTPLRPLPQTRVTAPLKSILKPYDPNTTFRRSINLNSTDSEPISAHTFHSFAEMLESVVKQLAQDLRAPRLDAYICLSNTLKALEDKPDEKSLENKMGLLSQFIQRDMVAVAATGAPDTTLSNQALKLLMALVRIPAAGAAMTDDFCSFTIDRVIQVVEDPESSKSSVNHHLGLLTLQNFSTRSMTSTRAEKILAVLENITDRVSGYGVQAYRLRVYRKLVRQAPEVMAARTLTWFKVVVKSMLSGQNDVRTSALEVAKLAGIEFVDRRQVSKAVTDYLNTTQANGSSIKVEYLIGRFTDMLSKKSEAHFVPEIWGAITLLLRPALEGNTWSQLSIWLKVLEDIIASCTDYQVNFQTTLAFGYLVFVTNPDQNTRSVVSKMLAAIPHFQLDRKGKSSNGKQSKEVSIAGSWALLYYSLRPSASAQELSRYWKEFVHGGWIQLVLLPRYADLACRMLSYLFGFGPTKIWNSRRVEKSRLITVEELPRLDPKWIRANMSLVLDFVGACLYKATYSKNSTLEENSLMRMWSCLMNSLAEAGSKEVKASMELKDAIARIVNMFRRLWAKHTSTPAMKSEEEEDWVSQFRFLVETSMEKLGAVHFADKFLTRNNNEDLEAAPTPSHRSRIQGAYQSPLLHIVDLLANQSEGKLSDNHRLDLVKWVIEPCLASKNTRSLKLELLMEYADLVRGSNETCMAANIWQTVAKYANATLEDYPLDTAEKQSRHLGEEYEVVIKILTNGLRYSTPQASSVAKDLLVCLSEKIKAEAGTGAVVLALVERLSEDISGQAKGERINNGLIYGATLFRQLPESINRRTVEEGRKSLWGASPMPPRTSDFDPYKRFYKTVVVLLSSAYDNLDLVDVLTFKDFIMAFSASIQKCPISLLGLYLRRIQAGVIVWIQDAGRKLQTRNNRTADTYRSIVSMWQTINEALKKLPKKDSSTLSALSPLVASGFLSRRRELTNDSVGTWNSTFGNEETLEYPPNVKRALNRLTPMVELQLPAFPHDEDQDSVASFYDSEVEQSQPEVEKSTDLVRETSPTLPTITTTAPLKSPASTSVSRGRTPLGQLPRARLRHDDSQIYFEEITSEPNDSMVQQSQVLTDRQLEVLEKQRATAAMLPDIRSSPVAELPRSSVGVTRLNLTSDLPNIDSDDALHTPLKGRKSLGPMDYYVGSSPTPRNRSRTKQIMSDTSVATPDAVRKIQVTAPSEDDPPSSPPDMETTQESLGSYILETASDAAGIVEDSFEYRQVEKDVAHDLSDEIEVHETTEFDSRVPFSSPQQAGSVEDDNEINNEVDDLTPEEDEDLPSPNPESQLAAQITTDMEALEKRSVEVITAKSSGNLRRIPEVNGTPSVILRGHAEQQLDKSTLEHLDDSSPLPEPVHVAVQSSPDQSIPVPQDNQSATSEDMSRVGDSFLATDSSFHTAVDMPRRTSTTNIQRSFRNTPSSPAQSSRSTRNTPSSSQATVKSSQKRKESLAVADIAAKRVRKQSTPRQTPVPSIRRTPSFVNPADDEEMLDCIVVDMNSPLTRRLGSTSAEKQPRVVVTPASSPAPNNKTEGSATSNKMMPPPISSAPAKRKPGRPRKDATDAEKPTRSTKRSVRLSVPELGRSVSDSTHDLVDETRAPKRVKRTASQGISRATSLAPSETSSHISITRKLDHVAIGPTPRALKDAAFHPPSSPIREQHDEPSPNQEAVQQPIRRPSIVAAPAINAEASSQASRFLSRISTPLKRTADAMATDAPATPSHARTPLGRIMATPSSILAKLRKIVADCSQMVLGSQEEREFDDVLFDIRTRVHDAGRRGRDT
ncbi:uncharacterized protein BDZ99DRAFT_525478 [Mytilinidion resinicola]|uniref:Telomere-associated protein Rif1 N-terminal domain-containing protein n=1 Tax=Mytilinidion resinicola TaxID=574789 RepID=A0A6A6Y9Z4_9PEZI|nr:uncharacterized protein BDZ99DRAFT_525478 [Mytilinidion resinicola]KAF2804647.1 hypothetical protein BDZ99DRAFT_525478 [Mytilinidion resinicola]